MVECKRSGCEGGLLYKKVVEKLSELEETFDGTVDTWWNVAT